MTRGERPTTREEARRDRCAERERNREICKEKKTRKRNLPMRSREFVCNEGMTKQINEESYAGPRKE